jgi:hypothetical protein
MIDPPPNRDQDHDNFFFQLKNWEHFPYHLKPTSQTQKSERMEMAGPGLPYHIRVKLRDFTDNYLLATNKKFPDHRIPEILEVLNSQRVAIDKMDYIARERYYNRLATDMFHLNVPSPDQISCKSPGLKMSMLSAQANLHVDVTVGNPSSPDSKRNIGDSKVRVDEVLDGPQTNVVKKRKRTSSNEISTHVIAIQAVPRKKHEHQRFKVWRSNRDCDCIIEPSKHLTEINAQSKRDAILTGKKIKLEASVANAPVVTSDDASENARVKSLIKLQSMNEDEIQDHFSCLERNRATLNPTEKIEMSLCLIHPEHRQSLTIDDLRFIQNHHRAIKIAQILNRHPDNQLKLNDRLVDVQKMCRRYFPEEHVMITKLIEDVNKLMEGLGYQNGGLFDRTTKLSKELIVNNIRDPKNKPIISSLISSQTANVFKELRHVLIRVGYTLSAFDTVTSKSAGEQKKKRLRKGRSKIQIYKICMHSEVARLLDTIKPPRPDNAQDSEVQPFVKMAHLSMEPTREAIELDANGS